MTQVLDGFNQDVATDTGIYVASDVPAALVDLESRFDRLWIGTVTVSDPLPPASIQMRGITRAPALGGMLLVAQDFDTTQITAELYRLSAPTTLVASLTNTRNRQWQETLSDPGSASLVFQADDADLASVIGDGDDLILLKYAGVAALMMICETAEQTYISEQEEAEEVTVWSGRGHLALLERSQVYPTGGVGRRPIEDDRVFNWTSLDFDDTGWALAQIIDTVGGAQASWNLGLGPFFDADFPDATASVLWASSGTANFAPTGYCYFRQDITVATTGLHTLYFLTDNQGELHVDGQRILESDDFAEMSQISLELTAGSHVIAVRGYNAELDGGLNINDPAGIAWALYETNAATGEIGVLVAHSDATSRIVEYPAEPPGMTPGQVMRLVLAEAQARNELLYITLGFDDDVDSDGEAWPTTSEIATKVGTDYLTFFREMSGTYIDLWMPPGSLELQAYNLFGRGSTKAVTLRAPTDVTDPSTGNITTYRKKRDASPINRFLARWPGGWAEREDATSIASYAARGATLGLGALDSLAEVYRVADAQLAIYDAPREEITIGIHPASDADRPYMAFAVGDTITIPDAAGGTTTERVISLTVGEDEFTGLALLTVQLGNLLIPEEARLFQALKKMVNGTIQGDSKVAQPVALSGLFELRRIPGANTPSGVPLAFGRLLTSGTDVSTTTNLTASIQPTGDALVLLALHIKTRNSTNPVAPTSVTGCGLTWVLAHSQASDTGGVTRGRLYVYRAMGAAPTAGQVTITLDGSNSTVRCAWKIQEFSPVDTSGTDGSGAIVQIGGTTVASGQPSHTLGAFSSADNGTFGAVGSDTGGVVPEIFIPGSGFTQFGSPAGDAIAGTDAEAWCSTEFRADNDTVVDGTIVNSSQSSATIAAEIKSA